MVMILLALIGSLLVLSTSCMADTSTADEYDMLRDNWRDYLTGNDVYDSKHKAMASHVAKIAAVTNSSRTGVWDTMQLGNASGLWPDLESTSNPAQITESFRRIEKLAFAYATEGSRWYQDENLAQDIIAAMQWMSDNRYKADASRYGNWWEWEIGSPLEIVTIIVLMDGKLPASLVDRYDEALRAIIPDPAKRANCCRTPETGANLAEKSLIVALHGIIERDEMRVAQAHTAIQPLFKIVSSGDGFYRDGSFIQHANVPYTGSYGVVLIDRLSKFLTLLDGSRWDITTAQANTLSTWYRDAFEPLIQDGAMVDMVRGRAIAREGSNPYTIGRTAMHAFLRISKLLPSQQALEIQSSLKYGYKANRVLNYTYYGLDVSGMRMVDALLNDSTITPRGKRIAHFQFPSMDRVMHIRQGFSYGLSLYSDRILNYEAMNDENKKGWYTGNGMTYLYTSDYGQFVDGYWPTVDPLRLPGTTTDGRPKASERSTKSWVGGAVITGSYGSAGMQFQYSDSGLTGNKSWFMFDDEIVAMGSGITAEQPGVYETIVENRKLSEAGDETFVINGLARSDGPGWSSSFADVDWAHLTGSVTGSSIGYVFPNETALTVLREARTGNWAQLSKSESTKQITRNYLTMWVNHGEQPSNASYAYILLPNTSAAATKEYSGNKDVRILAQNSTVHAVEETTLGITAANFWKAGSIGAISVDQPASVLIRERGGVLEVSVSDPTQRQTSLTVTLDLPGYSVQKAHRWMKVTGTSPKITIKVDVSAAAGESARMYFEKR
jgi:hypothetical protein